MSSRSVQSEVQHFDLLNDWLVAGGSNGILSVEQKKLLCGRVWEKQCTGLELDKW